MIFYIEANHSMLIFCMVYANALDSNAQTEMVNAHNKYRKRSRCSRYKSGLLNLQRPHRPMQINKNK